MFDVIAIGDTTQDIFLQMHDANVQCDLKGEHCQICFDFANKIAVEKKTDIPAVGNAANHVVGVARLGLKAAIYAIVGDDDQGRKAKEVFEQNKVDTRYLVFDKQHGTNLSVVINFKGERTIFVYHEPREYQLPDFEPPHWLYLTSAGKEGVETIQQQILRYMANNPAVKLAFNPGTHQMHQGLESLKPIIKETDILFLNREESMNVLGTDMNDPVTLVKSFHKLGVQIMVLTDGPKGAYASDGQAIYFLPVFPGPVVERTGCGDAFASAFVAAIIKGHDFKQAMLWGNANSTAKLLYIGAREGLLTEDGVHKMIEENSTITPQPYPPT